MHLDTPKLSLESIIKLSGSKIGSLGWQFCIIKPFPTLLSISKSFKPSPNAIESLILRDNFEKIFSKVDPFEIPLAIISRDSLAAKDTWIESENFSFKKDSNFNNFSYCASKTY